MLASLEKIVPTLEDASTILRLLARSATGPGILDLYHGLDRPAPRRATPTGRSNTTSSCSTMAASRMLGTEFQDMLRCIRCGACFNHCPVYGAVGGHAYGWVYAGPMGAVLTPR